MKLFGASQNILKYSRTFPNIPTPPPFQTLPYQTKPNHTTKPNHIKPYQTIALYLTNPYHNKPKHTKLYTETYKLPIANYYIYKKHLNLISILIQV